ncbi:MULTISPECIES: CidA/LrgA family protein [Rhizobium]|uniref:CidA/LrgA family protein n=1 Tax=Rhizobium lentis TaxID=1138194 RepID=A0ABS7IAH1_9HYPH|nr:MULTISPECIES: CidA/LrgA family protein [Rhizobium]MBX4958231.1 CidA/LrgA family protein [Rhizobium lentis]MBX4976401.1 CidA/LrgA family protein [Rhizobium lentis]MBX4988235.1 CidA/LrgA family protein [Rhizobium lentis]MBX5006684.1 CidA/LrgA family protein [Rhizobium lentis]MBX5031281.1 CidA/LrgA family protein [Rhizobium lentis]
MLVGITFLLIFQLFGEVIAYYLHGLVPGPVIGMALIFGALTASKRTPIGKLMQPTVSTSHALLANFGALFVPAGVGIIQHLDLLAERGLTLFVTISVSTVATLIVTVWCYLAIKRLIGGTSHG